jgi:N-acetyl sugar amidotransferase
MNVTTCTNCIYDSRVASISFNDRGVCNYCEQIAELAEFYQTGGEIGKQNFQKILTQIKKRGEHQKYDCIIGVSGGTDSSYLLYAAKELWGLKPLAVHYDNTWNTAVASMNIERMLTNLEIDLYTHVVANEEMDDIFRAFFMSGVAEIEGPTDLGYAYVLRQAARKFKVKFIIEGHSFREEGITPLGRNYFDGRYIREIHRKFGSKKIESYPLMTISRFLYSSIWIRPKFIRPLWYIQYTKQEARDLLVKKFNWQYYGGHHLENRMTTFLHQIYLPLKFNTDMRNNTLSAEVRNGYKERSVALTEYHSPQPRPHEVVEYFCKRLNIDEKVFWEKMQEDPRSWQEFPTYKKTFERLRYLFLILAKANLVPMSFYIKYCKA